MSTPHVTHITLSNDLNSFYVHTKEEAFYINMIKIEPGYNDHNKGQRDMLKSISKRGNEVLKKINQLVRSIYDTENEVFELSATDLTGGKHLMLRPHSRYYVRKKNQDKSKEILRLLYRVVFEQLDAYRLKQSPARYPKTDLTPYIAWISLTQLSSEQMKIINMLSTNQYYGSLDIEKWKVINND